MILMNTTLNILRKNYTLLLYAFVIIVLMIGIYAQSGTSFFFYLFVFVASFYSCSFLFLKLKLHEVIHRMISTFQLPVFYSERIAIFAIVSVVACIGIHLTYIGELPVLVCLNSVDELWIADYRNSLTRNTPTIINYMSSFLITAAIPFFMVYVYQKMKTKWFWFFTVLSAIYALNLLQKSYIVTIFIPILMFFIVSKKWTKVFLLSAFCAVSVLFLVMLSNPSLRSKSYESAPEQKQAIEKIKVDEEVKYPLVNAIIGTFERVVYTPGKVVSQWFEAVPEKLPFQHGCGYRFLAPVLGCEFREYAYEIYPIAYPHYVERGFSGSVNTASFMYDYVNFGTIGLALSGLLLALIFCFVQGVFLNDHEGSIIFNTFPVLILSSTSISTLMFSGGWGLLLLLYFLFGKTLTIKQYE